MSFAPGVDVGTLKLIPEASRPGWVLSGGTASSFTDVDFGPYRPAGTKALLISWYMSWSGNGADDGAMVILRKNGSAVFDDSKQARLDDHHTNLGGSIQRAVTGERIVECDANGIIEYGFVTVPTTRSLYLTIFGYYL